MLRPVRGIEVPERTEDFTADPVELFFDLAYVLAFSQLVGVLVEDHTWAGIGRMALLFGLLWLPWQQLTWAANAVSGNGRGVRVIFLIATATSVPMAASTSTALEGGGPVFAATLAVIMVLGFVTQILGAERGTVVYRSVIRWQAPNVAALIILMAGAAVHGQARLALWLLSVAVVLAAMIAAGRGDWIVRSGHFAERHGLIVIIALGEVIVAIGLPVIHALEAGDGIAGRTVVALAAAGVFAGLLWWAYFDRVGPALEHRGRAIQGEREQGRYVRDVYTWAHAPIVAGIILAAAALEEITLHPTGELPLPFRVMFAGGLVLSVVGIAAAIWRAFRTLPRERLFAVAVLVPVIVLAGGLEGIVLLVAVDIVMGATLAAEHVRVER